MEAKRRKIIPETNVNESASEVGDNHSDAEAGNVASDSEKLKALLDEWNVPSFHPILLKNDINYKKLQYLEDPYYDSLIKNGEESLGNLLIFRHCHMRWKNEFMNSESDNLTTNVNVRVTLRDGGEKSSKITSFFETNRHLTDELREDLVHLILQERKYLSREMMSDIANQICKIFPGEKKGTYYEVRGSQVTGLLYVRYNQLRQKYTGSNKPFETPVPVPLTDELRFSMEYVNNDENYHAPYDELFRHWDTTYAYRKSKSYTVEQALNEWPILRRPDGYVMIQSDFLNEYNETIGHSLKSKWDGFVSANFKTISEGIKNARARRDLENSVTDDDYSVKNRKIFMALHHVSCLIPAKVTTKKKTWTPSIVCSEEAFLKIVSNRTEVATEMKIRNDFCTERSIPYHPLLFECPKKSEDLDDTEGVDANNYLIGICDTIYECDSLIDAVDSAFKMFAILKIPFPPECKKIWLFLNEIFYKIQLQQQPTYNLVSSLNSFIF